jgi:hypothetical protein
LNQTEKKEDILNYRSSSGKEMRTMSLNIKEWGKAGFTNWQSGQGITLPFDRHFRPDDPRLDNRIALSQVGSPLWYISISFDAPLDRSDPSYPHFIKIHDNADCVTLKVVTFYSGTVGVEGGKGPVPNAIGKHDVQFVFLNREQKPILSQSGNYYVDPG